MEVSRWVVGFAVSGLTLVKLSLNRLLRLNLRCGFTTLRLVRMPIHFVCTRTSPGLYARSRGVHGKWLQWRRMSNHYPIHLFLCANLNISSPIPSQAISMHAKAVQTRFIGLRSHFKLTATALESREMNCHQLLR